MFENLRERMGKFGSNVREFVDYFIPEAPEPQACCDPEYVRVLQQNLGLPHVAPINGLVDLLREDRPGCFTPYVAPTFGGTEARLLSLFQSPGGRVGLESGMLCVENDDGTSQRHKEYLRQYCIGVHEVVAWNAFPWEGSDKNRTLKEKREATEALEQLVGLLPHLEVVMLHGRVAQDAWERLRVQNQELADAPHVIETYHTSPRLVDPQRNSQATIDKYEDNLKWAFVSANHRLRGGRLDDESWTLKPCTTQPPWSPPHVGESPSQ